MAHNQQMLEENPDWEGKIRIIGLSIDSDKKKLQDHVAKNGWGKIENFFGVSKDFQNLYGLVGIPHIMLIDKTGKVVFVGHPAKR